MTQKDLSDLAKSLAIRQKSIGHCSRRVTQSVLKEFTKDSHKLLARYKSIRVLQKTTPLTPAQKWFLENQAIILENAKEVKAGLTVQMVSRLPVLKPHHKEIRVVQLLLELIKNSDHQLNQHRLERFLNDYQVENPLTIAELWAIPLVAKTILLHVVVDCESEQLIKDVILGLRNLDKIDWRQFVEEASLMEKILRRDPAGIYPLMDFRTRDSYRHVIEEIFFQSGHDQNEIAHWVVNEAKKGESTHIGFLLLGQGRDRVEKVFIPKRKLAENFLRFLHRRPIKIYFGTLWGVSLLLFLFLQSLFPVSWLVRWLLLLPSLHLSNLITHIIMVRLFPPDFLPKINSELPIPDKNRTLVLVPTLLWADLSRADKILEVLESSFLTNRDPNIFFMAALAFTETTENSGRLNQQEEETLAYFKDKLAQLNKKYPSPTIPRFQLYFRERSWSDDEQKWVEKERKRGKVMEVVAHFATDFKYMVTVDDDQTIARDAVAKLVATISHPLNQPIIDRNNRKVIEGYGIIQPRLSTELPRTKKTLSDRLFAGDSGWDSYSVIASHTYQDIFREAFFQGKGIVDMEVFRQVLDDRLPDNTLLSHDHIEGFYCRTGYCPDIQLFESYPANYATFISRLHRWVRGDWQRIAWVIPHKDNPLSLFQKWKLAEDMLTNLCFPVTIFLTFLAPKMEIGIGLFLAVFVLPPLMAFVQGLSVEGNVLRIWRHYLAFFRDSFEDFLVKSLFNLVFSFHQSLVIVHAIGVSMYRLFISKRQRLQWTTFSQQKVASQNILWPTVLALLALLILTKNPLILIWLCAPIGIKLIDYKAQKLQPFTKAQRENLLNLARQTWHFFDVLVTKKTNFLPPDHFQQTTSPAVSTRTSATDMGMYLVALVCARDLGFVSDSDFLDRAGRTLGTMNKMDLFRGHFYNWYEVTTLRVLPPAYVSTVDSGNLCACLLVLSSALQELSGTRAKTLANLARKKALDMDFSFLYDLKRDLFRIGYNGLRKVFDRGHYDLLASESRLTSLLAIAKHDVPARHWAALSRPMTAISGQAALLSWGGSVFEYLFPNLFLPVYPQTLLGETQTAVVESHIKYGKNNHIPWGISESSYGLTNKDDHYRYKLHGIPGLGLKQFPYKDLVVAPYATLLALDSNPNEAYKNILQLQKSEAQADFGFFESVDFTHYESKQLPDKIIRTFLCHHQGSILAALSTALSPVSVRDRFEKNPLISSHLTFLQEKASRDLSLTTAQLPPATDVSEEQPVALEPTLPPVFEEVKTVAKTPQFTILSNGRYKTIFSDHGGGYSDFRQWRLTSDHFINFSEGSRDRVWSAGLLPTNVPAEKYRVSLGENLATVSRHNWDIESRLEITVDQDQDCEIRRLRLTNHSSQKRSLDMTSFTQIILDDINGYNQHPSYSKMKIKSEYLPLQGTLVFERLLPPENPPLVLATKILSPFSLTKPIFETDRTKSFSGTTGFTLDPICAWRVPVTLWPNSSVEFCFLTAVGTSREAAQFILANVNTTLDFNKTTVPAPFFNPKIHKGMEDLLACLFLGRGVSRQKVTAAMIKKMVPFDSNLDWSLPTISVIVTPTTNRGFVYECLTLGYYLANKGLRLNLILLVTNQDNYFQTTYNCVSDLVAEFETQVVNNNLISPLVSVVQTQNLTSGQIRFVTGVSNLVLDGKKGAVGKQIRKEFEKI
jgi:cyclic beta-1,2-glucan synthetase